VHRESWKSCVRGAALFGCLALLLLGCSEDPEAKKQRHFSRGEEFLSKQKADEAIIEFRNAIQVAPAFAEGHNQLGRAYQRKSWMFDARSEFQKAIELKPDFVDAHLNLASVSLDIGAVMDAETRRVPERTY
jgi:cytochrome c-type biogenesis protein CcmH/NrfG